MLNTEKYIEKSLNKHGDKYDYDKVNYINSKSHIIITCAIHGDFNQIPAKHLYGRGCPSCGGSKKLTTTEFVEMSKKIHGDKYDYSKSKYINNQTKILITCPIHGDFKQEPNNHIYKSYGCSSCSNNKKLTTTEFTERSNKLHNHRYLYNNVRYINMYSKVSIICKKHGEFDIRPYNHLNNHGCRKCKRSKGEEKISDILEKYNIKYISEHRFKDCKNIRSLPFDFYIPSMNICMEFDGRQHFESGFFGKKSFESTRSNDIIKNEFCLKNNINLIRIEYTTTDIEKRIKKELNL